jgi:hypothetical protein
MVIVILQPCQMFKIEHASNNHFQSTPYFRMVHSLKYNYEAHKKS